MPETTSSPTNNHPSVRPLRLVVALGLAVILAFSLLTFLPRDDSRILNNQLTGTTVYQTGVAIYQMLNATDTQQALMDARATRAALDLTASPTPSATMSPTPTPIPPRARVLRNTYALAAPLPDSDPEFELSVSVMVRLYASDEAQAWFKVRYLDQFGWVRATVLSVPGNVTNVPIEHTGD